MDQEKSKKLSWAKIKPFFWTAVGGAIVITILGFSWWGWVTGGTAQQMAAQMAEEAVTERLAKICVYQFNQDPEKVQKLKELKEKSSWERDYYVKEQGWATMPGEDEPDGGAADKCVELIVKSSQ